MYQTRRSYSGERPALDKSHLLDTSLRTKHDCESASRGVNKASFVLVLLEGHLVLLTCKLSLTAFERRPFSTFSRPLDDMHRVYQMQQWHNT
jgi:hypothetical protein